MASEMIKHIDDIEILGPDDEAAKEKQVRSKFWATVRKAIGSIPFMSDVVAAYYAMLDPATPRQSRLLVLAALVYFVSPFDLVPDFVFGAGFVDDASVLTAALAAVATSIRQEHREVARQAMANRGFGDHSDVSGATADAGA